MQSKVITVKIDRKTQINLDTATKKLGKNRSEVVRDAINYYISEKSLKPNAGTFLLKLAEEGKKAKLNAPKDLSTNMNKYLYDR